MATVGHLSRRRAVAASTVAACAIVLSALVAVGSVGCRAGLDPAAARQVYAEAESLRLEYVRDDSLAAVDLYRDAIDAWDAHARPGDAARAAQRMGATYEQLGDFEAALASYREGLALAAQAADPLLQSELAAALGLASALPGAGENSLTAAEQACRDALRWARQASSAAMEAKAFNCLGEVAYPRGDLDEYLSLHQQAEALWRTVDDTEGLAYTLLLIGYAHSDLSEFDAALSSFRDSLALWRTTGDRRGEAITLTAIARLHSRLRRYQEALDGFYPALEVFERMGDSTYVASCLTGIAGVYADLAEYDNALRYLERAAGIFESRGMTLYLADVYRSIGVTLLRLDRPDAALDRLEPALALSEELEHEAWVAFSLRDLGRAYQALNQPRRALEYFDRALQMQERGENPRLEVELLGAIGEAHRALGDRETAIDFFHRGLELSRTYDDRLGEARELFNLARAHRDAGDLDPARGYVENALAVAESLRAEVASQELRAIYLGSVHSYYDLHIDLLMRQHERRPAPELIAAAFEASEQARARSLLESLAIARVDLSEGLDPALAEQKQRLRDQLAEAYALQVDIARGAAADADIGEVSDRIRDLETDYRQAQAQIYSRNPAYAELAGVDALTLDQVQSQVLDDDTLLLEYSLGEQRSFLWAVSRDSSAVYELPAAEVIEAAATELYEVLTARIRQPDESVSDYGRRVRQASDRYRELAARLSDMLLAPATAEIAGKRILVAADGALQYLPFAALATPGSEDGTPLLASHEVISVPSASAIAVMRRETVDRAVPDGTVALLADPVYEADDERFASVGGKRAGGKLPGFLEGVGIEQTTYARALRAAEELELQRLRGTSAEARAIADAAADGRVWSATGFDASREQAMNPELARYRIIHFATHAVVNGDNPGLSGLILSTFDRSGQPRDGFLRLNDIYSLRLPAELVVLSACNTALGEQIRGEGLVGIVRGFMYAGSKRVVASLWKVDDVATGELMARFYDHMLQDGLTAAEALRQAQLSMLAEPQFADPFYWAGFVLQGEWRAR